MKIRNLILVLLVVTTLLVGTLGLAGRTSGAAAITASWAASNEFVSLAWSEAADAVGFGPIAWDPGGLRGDRDVAWNS
jgi:hypothetical protein